MSEISTLVDYSSTLDFVQPQSLIHACQEHVIHDGWQNYGKSLSEDHVVLPFQILVFSFHAFMHDRK